MRGDEPGPATICDEFPACAGMKPPTMEFPACAGMNRMLSAPGGSAGEFPACAGMNRTPIAAEEPGGMD